MSAPVLRPMLPGTGKLLKETWGDYTQRFWTYIGISVIPTIVTLLLVAFGVGGALLGQDTLRSSYLVAGGGIMVLIIAIIAAIIIYLWSAVALLYAMVHASEGVGVQESFRQSWRKIGSYFWISFISGVIAIGGFLLGVIPGIIFSVWFMFALYIFLSEGDRGFQALLKSREYARNYWWPVFGRTLLMGLIVGGIYIVFIIFASIGSALALEGTGVEAVLQILQQLLSIVITPFAMLFSLRIYTNLKSIKGQVILGAEAQKDKKLITWLTVLGFLMPLIILILVVTVVAR